MATYFKILWETIKAFIVFALLDVVLFFSLALMLSLSSRGMAIVDDVSAALDKYAIIVIIAEAIISFLIGLIVKNRLRIWTMVRTLIVFAIGIIVINAILVFAFPQIFESFNPLLMMLGKAVLLIIISVARGVIADLKSGRKTGGGDPNDILIMGDGLYRRGDLDK